MMNNINSLQDISLIIGEITEQFFYRLRSLITSTILNTQKQLFNISDHPNLKIYFSQLNLKEILKNMDHLQNFSKESLLKFLYIYSEFLRNIIEFLKPFEPSLISFLYQNIFLPSLYSDSILSINSMNINLKSSGNILTKEEIIQKIKDSPTQKIYFLFPSLLSDEKTWENSITNTEPFEYLLINKNIFPIKLQFNPNLTIKENADHTFNTIKYIIDSLEKNYKFGIIAFSTGNYLLRSILYGYHSYLKDKLNCIIFINSPELGLKLERLVLWAGLGYQYDSIISLKLLRILTNSNFKIINEFDNSFLFQREFLEEEIKILQKFPIYKIYSMISENNTIWSPWLGDGFIEEPSLSYYDDKLNPNNIFVLNGISHLQILVSSEVKNILNPIL